ncbi:MAG: hypothetical protein ACFE9N_16660, partial [Promethearchaeota archaeon]
GDQVHDYREYGRDKKRERKEIKKYKSHTFLIPFLKIKVILISHDDKFKKGDYTMEEYSKKVISVYTGFFFSHGVIKN